MVVDECSAAAAAWAAVALVFMLIANSFWRRRLERGGDSGGSGEDLDDLPLPPGDLGFMLIGETHKLAFQGYDFFRQRRAKYGRIYKTHLFGQPTIRLFGSQNLAKILKSEEQLVKMHWPKSVKMVLGDRAVSHLSRREHSVRRAHLLRVFNRKVLEGCIARVQETLRSRLDAWCKSGRVGGCAESRRLAMHIMMQSVMGIDLSESLADELFQAMNLVEQGLFSLPYDIPGTAIHKALRARRFIVGHVARAMNRERSDEAGFFTMLKQADAGWNLTDRDVQDECMSMLLTSFQALSSVLCTLLLQLARHPQCVAKARQELEDCGLDVGGGGGGQLSFDELLKLPYVDSIVKEALRVTPPVGGGYRKVLRTFALGGYRIPKGWTLLYSIRDQHEVGDTGIEDSSEFDPDRWRDETRLSRMGKYSYLPFGGDGQRSCVGARFVQAILAVAVTELIANFRWTVADSQPKIIYFPIPFPADGLPLTIERRCRLPPSFSAGGEKPPDSM